MIGCCQRWSATPMRSNPSSSVVCAISASVGPRQAAPLGQPKSLIWSPSFMRRCLHFLPLSCACVGRSLLRHVSPMQRETSYRDEGEGVGCEDERRLGPVHGGVYPRCVVSSAQRRHKRSCVHPGQCFLQCLGEVEECCSYVD